MRLKSATPPQWIETVLKDFDAFLLDHAACERKASATGMNLVAHYPDKTELVRAMIDFALEELDHFRRVYRKMEERGLSFRPDEKDEYVKKLQRHVRKEREAYLLDRLLVAGIIEARGTERFHLVAKALEEGPLKEFYRELASVEAKHHALFVKLAHIYYDKMTVEERLEELLEAEAKIIEHLPLRAAVH
jgi:tRNA 2-(methylsulfanyl)-N6-isopentenyladenosine37 hydroxylase